MQETSAVIQKSEADVRQAFRLFDAQSAALRAQHNPPDPTIKRTVGELMILAARFDPAKIKEKHSEIEQSFFKSVEKSVDAIRAQKQIAREFIDAADYLDGTSTTPPKDESLFEYCAQVKAAVRAGASIDPHTLAEDVRRNVRGASAECERVLNTWGAKSTAAMIVTARTKRYLFSHELKLADVTQQRIKMDVAKATFERKFGAMATRRRGVR